MWGRVDEATKNRLEAEYQTNKSKYEEDKADYEKDYGKIERKKKKVAKKEKWDSMMFSLKHLFKIQQTQMFLFILETLMKSRREKYWWDGAIASVK